MLHSVSLLAISAGILYSSFPVISLARMDAMTKSESPTVNAQKPTTAELQRSFLRHLQYTLVKDKYSATKTDLYLALAHAVRDVLVDNWLDTQQSYYINDAKRVYYISMEFLMGRALGNSLINLDIMDEWQTALKEMGIDIQELLEKEWDCLLYTSPSPRDRTRSRMPSSA